MAVQPSSVARRDVPGVGASRGSAPVAGGIAWLIWAVVSIPIVLGARGNEAEAIARLIFVIAIPSAVVAGLAELALARRCRATALAVLATVSGVIGGLLAGVLVVSSMRAPESSEVGGAFLLEGLLLTIVCVGQVLLAVSLLPGRGRLLPLGAALLPIVAIAPALGGALGPPEPGTWLSRPGSGWATRIGGDERVWTGPVECHWRQGYADGVASVSGFDIKLDIGDGSISQLELDAREGVGSAARLTVNLGGGSLTRTPGRLAAVASDGFEGAVEATSHGVLLSWSCPE